jgi:hypothetical protein
MGRLTGSFEYDGGVKGFGTKGKKLISDTLLIKKMRS